MDSGEIFTALKGRYLLSEEMDGDLAYIARFFYPKEDDELDLGVDADQEDSFASEYLKEYRSAADIGSEIEFCVFCYFTNKKDFLIQNHEQKSETIFALVNAFFQKFLQNCVS